MDNDELLSLDHDWGINAAGRLSHAGAGEIIFGGLAEPSCNPNSQGDLNGSGKVDFGDFIVLAENFNQSVADHTAGDINCNGKVVAGFWCWKTRYRPTNVDP